MDKTQFLQNLRNSRVTLHPLQVEGWEGVIYLRTQTLEDVRDILAHSGDQGDEGGEAPSELIKKDPLYFARTVARMVRDETGALLFDARDDEQMAELMGALKDTAPTVSKQINEAYKALNSPIAPEVTPEGNSPSANSS